MNAIELGGRRSVVTGGAQGIGRAITERLLRSGSAVSIWDRDQGELDRAVAELQSLGKVAGARVDVTVYGEVEAAVRATDAAIGGIDILVCNAGIAGMTTKLWEYPLEEWARVVDIDLTGCLLYTSRCV